MNTPLTTARTLIPEASGLLRAWAAVACAALGLFCATPAAAQTSGGDLQRFTPSGTPFTGFAAAAGELLAPGEFALGMHFNYARNPLVYIVDGHRTASSIRVNSTLQLHAVMGVLERFELSAGLPLVVHQGGGDPLYGGGPATGFGDLRIRPRVQILQQWRNGIALTLSPTLTIPLTRSSSPLSEGSVRFLPEAGLSWRGQRWFFSADALFRWRLKQEPLPRVLTGSEFELVAAVGRILSDDIEAIFELNGGLALATMKQGLTGNPLEALVGLRFRIGESWTLDVTGGAGLLSAPGVPDFRGVVGLTWGAGRPRTSETCVLHGPNGDQVVRQVGRDTDGDGIDDACDLCPYQASSEPGGCPAALVCAPPPPAPPPPPPPKPIAVKALQIPPVRLKAPAATTLDRRLFLPIQFDFDKDTIRPTSLKLVKQAVDELSRLPAMMICRVLGHTDDRGTVEYNLDLSRRRSESVVRAMIKLGADAKRLTLRGFGIFQPTAHDDKQSDKHDRTAKGRQANRRVEFVFSMPGDLDQDVAATAVPLEPVKPPDATPAATEPAKGATEPAKSATEPTPRKAATEPAKALDSLPAIPAQPGATK